MSVAHGVLSMACPIVWDVKRRPCIAWGAPSSHGCQRAPGHDGIHVCPCGSKHAASVLTGPQRGDA